MKRTLLNLYEEALAMKRRAIMDGHSSIPLNEFNDYVFCPLALLLREEYARQLEEIRERGT